MNVDDKIVSPKCPTEYVVFSEDKVEINNKKIKIYLPSTRKTISNFNSLNDEIVNQVVAEQLRLCWWQMLEGKRSFGETFWLYNSVGDNCFICNEIKFDETLSKESFSGIYQYLKSTQIPSQKITYYEYISDIKIYNSQLYDDYPEKNIWEEFADGVKTGESIKDLEFDTRPEIKRELVFEKGKSYYVIFDRHGQKSGIPKTRQGSETEQGLDTTQTFFTYVIPSEQIGEVCNSVSRGITS